MTTSQAALVTMKRRHALVTKFCQEYAIGTMYDEAWMALDNLIQDVQDECTAEAKAARLAMKESA